MAHYLSHPSSSRVAAFSLVELLVTIAVIAVLIGILLPVLSGARNEARRITCAQNLRQIGIALHAYANDSNGAIPHDYDAPVSSAALQRGYFGHATPTNTIYLHDSDREVGLGQLLNNYVDDERIAFCPADDSNNPVEELENIEKRIDFASSSYYYRQLGRTSGNRIDDLGESNAGLKATALVMDANSLITTVQHAFNTNHQNQIVNILYNDGRVKTFANSTDLNDGLFSVRNQDLSNPPDRLLDIFTRADFGAIGNPEDY